MINIINGAIEFGSLVNPYNACQKTSLKMSLSDLSTCLQNSTPYRSLIRHLYLAMLSSGYIYKQNKRENEGK